MRILSREKLGTLLQSPGYQAVSIYMPTERSCDIEQNPIRLLQCTRHYVREVTPEGVPTNLDEAWKYDDPEKQRKRRAILLLRSTTCR